METRERALALFNFAFPHLAEPEIEYLEIEIEDEEYDSAIGHVLESCSYFDLIIPADLVEIALA